MNIYSKDRKVIEDHVADVEKECYRYKSDVQAITRDRDSLIALIDQQEIAMKLQNQQYESTLKVLQKRQEALDKLEEEAGFVEDELSRLQRKLTDFLQREGDNMVNETMDVKKFVMVISEVRDEGYQRLCRI